MSWSRAALLALCLCAAGCGFEPLYAGGGQSVAAHYAEVDVANIPDRDGQFLRNALIDRLYVGGRPADAKYELKIDPLKETSTDLGIQKDATVTRTQIEISARLRLVDRETARTLLDRTVRAVGGYDVLDQQYTTVITRQSVTENILTELSDNVLRELDLYFKRGPGIPSNPPAGAQKSPGPPVNADDFTTRAQSAGPTDIQDTGSAYPRSTRSAP
jgi:LPS-assembly lipoprotein